MSDPDRVVVADIEQLTSDILERWRRQLRGQSDDRPRTGDRGESERLLVTALLRAASANDDSVLPGLAVAAAQYGSEQRRDRLDPGGLCEELSCLRQLVWSELRTRQSNVNQAVDRILRFDRALSIVVKAAVTAGYSPNALAGESPCSESHAHELRSDKTTLPEDR